MLDSYFEYWSWEPGEVVVVALVLVREPLTQEEPPEIPKGLGQSMGGPRGEDLTQELVGDSSEQLDRYQRTCRCNS